MDGAPPAGPGFYISEYLAYYTAYRLEATRCRCLRSARSTIWVNLNQFLYQSDTPVLFGGKWGLDVIVPFVSIDSEPSACCPTMRADWATSWSAPTCSGTRSWARTARSSCTGSSSRPSGPPAATPMRRAPQPRQQPLLVRPLLGGHVLASHPGGPRPGVCTTCGTPRTTMRSGPNEQRGAGPGVPCQFRQLL